MSSSLKEFIARVSDSLSSVTLSPVSADTVPVVAGVESVARATGFLLRNLLNFSYHSNSRDLHDIIWFPYCGMVSLYCNLNYSL